MLIEKEGEPMVGLWNGLVLSLGGLLFILIALGVGRYIFHEPEPEVVVLLGEPVPVEVEECLILLPAEIAPEPDYRLGRGEECRSPAN